jgi:hypothetical protein
MWREAVAISNAFRKPVAGLRRSKAPAARIAELAQICEIDAVVAFLRQLNDTRLPFGAAG